LPELLNFANFNIPKLNAMKRVICAFIQYVSLSAFFFILCINTSISQEQVVWQKTKALEPIDNCQQQITNNQYSGLRTQDSGLKSYGDTIWYEDFDSTRWSQYGLGEGPEGWEFKDLTENDFLWAWSKDGPRGRYTSLNGGDTIKDGLEPNNAIPMLLNENGASCNNGFMQFEMDWFNTGEDGQLDENYSAMDSYVQTTVDITHGQNLMISYYQLYRWCCSGANQLSLFVATDYDPNYPETTHWVEFDSRGLLASSSDLTYIPDIYISFDISEIANGCDELTLRWHVIGASHYYWIIDDVFITEAPANDLVLTRAWWDYGHPPYTGPGADYDYDWSGGYTKIPIALRQDFVSFRAAVINLGYETQNDVKLNVAIFKDDEEIFNETSAGVILEKEGRDTLSLMTNFTPPGIGEYMISSTVISENLEEKPIDNSMNYEFDVTENDYSRVYEAPFPSRVMTGAWVSGGNPGDALIVRYEIYEYSEINDISTFFWNNNDSEQIDDIEAGNFSMIGRLYKLDEETDELPITPIISTERRIMSMADTMSWITMDFIEDGEAEFLTPGIYYAGIETYTSGVDIDFEIAEDKRIQQPTDNALAIFSGDIGGLDSNPVIIIDLGSISPLNQIVFNLDVSSGNVNPVEDYVYVSGNFSSPEFPEPGSDESIELTDEDGDMNYSGTIRIEPGEYKYKYFINAGWEGGEGDEDFWRELVVTESAVLNDIWYTDLKDIEKHLIKIFPNPANKNVTIKGMSPIVDNVKIYNILGKEFTIKPIHPGSEININVSHLPNGIYFIKINNETHKIIINH
jgi:Secretion system C-terminal sorting domain